MPTQAEFIPVASSQWPGTWSFTEAGGVYTAPYFIDPEKPEQAIISVVGAVRAGDKGRLVRALPLRNSQFRWLWASKISNATGIGVPRQVASGAAGGGFDGEENALDEHDVYDMLKTTIEFTPRKYDLLDDARIGYYELTWTDFDGTVVKNYITEEWKRYTEFEWIDKSDFLTAQQGSMFVVSEAADIVPTASADSVHGQTFTGKPRMLVPADQIHITWHMVPASFVTSARSNLRRWKNRVNIDPWLDYAAGELLYLGATYKTYVPPYPATAGDVGNPLLGPGMLADIKMVFEIRSGITVSGPANAGVRQFRSPHNSSPAWLDRRWRSIVTTAADPDQNDRTKWWPPYLAAPIPQVLFSNPDQFPA